MSEENNDRVWIKCLTKFLEDTTAYYEGEVVSVTREEAERFCGNGWAESASIPTGVAHVGETDLTVNPSAHKTTATNVEV